MTWQEAMDLPGASQMKYLRRLIESRPMLDRIPDQTLITNARAEHDRVQATRGKDYLMIYSSEGRPFTVNLGKITGKTLASSWYNPRNGEIKVGDKVPNVGSKIFTPPGNGYGQDWVLILDDNIKGYKAPQ